MMKKLFCLLTLLCCLIMNVSVACGISRSLLCCH